MRMKKKATPLAVSANLGTARGYLDVYADYDMVRAYSDFLPQAILVGIVRLPR